MYNMENVEREEIAKERLRNIWYDKNTDTFHAYGLKVSGELMKQICLGSWDDKTLKFFFNFLI